MISLSSLIASHEALMRAREERRRARQERAAARLMAVPHWLDRAAAGALPIPAGLPESVRREIGARRREIEWLRARRREARLVVRARDGARARIWWRGVVPITAYTTRGFGSVWYAAGHEPRPNQERHDTRRAAAREYLATRTRVVHRRYILQYRAHAPRPWILRHDVYGLVATWGWGPRPSRDEIRSAVIAQRAARARALRQQRAARPDTAAPNTLGWRAWVWDDAERCLRSPHRGIPWIGPDLRVERWDESEALRGVAGIHARLMPRDWIRAGWPARGESEGPSSADRIVTGIVERYGRYVLGTHGWRAEHVVIRELCAPSVRVMIALMRAYPEARVHLSPYATQEDSCTSET